MRPQTFRVAAPSPTIPSMEEALRSTLAGFPIQRSWYVKGDQMLVMTDPFNGNKLLFLHPWFNLDKLEYRPPFWTRYSLGVREAQRDRRQTAKL